MDDHTEVYAKSILYHLRENSGVKLFMYGTSLKERMESKFLILYMQLTHMDDI
jgi:hypothetical protein